MQRNGSSRSLPGDTVSEFLGPPVLSATDSSPSKKSRSTRNLRRERSKLTIRSLSAAHIRVDIDFAENIGRAKRTRGSSSRIHVLQGVILGLCLAYLMSTIQTLYNSVETLQVNKHSNLPKMLRISDDIEREVLDALVPDTGNSVPSVDPNETVAAYPTPLPAAPTPGIDSPLLDASRNQTLEGNDEDVEQTKAADVDLLPQPFTGAKDSQGAFGYIANTTVPTFPSMFDSEAESQNVCSAKPGDGNEGKGGWSILANKVVVDKNVNRHPRVLCTIYTHEKNHDRVSAISKTWGSRCDGFWAASTETDEAINAVDLSHEGVEAYSNMWQKTRSILAYNYKNYLEDFDYFYIAGDDTYMIVENLKMYLREYEANPHSPYLLAGHYMITKSLYIGGGGGYVINREALKKFVGGGGLEKCLPHAIMSAEDRFISNCMEKDNIPLADTADSHGRQRFFSRDPDWLSSYKGRGGVFAKVFALWERQHGAKRGAKIVSTSAISFHHIRGPESLKRVHAILYRSCPESSILAQSLNKAVQLS